MNLKSTKSYLLIIALGLILPLQIFSQDQKVLDVAVQHLQENREKHLLTEADISNYIVSDFYTSKHNGVTHIYLQQQHEGITVFNAINNINLLPDGRVLNMGNRFISDLANKVNTTQSVVEPADALKTVAYKFSNAIGYLPKIKERKTNEHFVFENAGIALDPIHVKLMYALQDDGTVQLVWQVRLYKLDGQHMWNTQVDATSGKILNYFDEVIHCDFNHTHDNCTASKEVNSSFDSKKTVTDFSRKDETFLADYFSPIMGNTYNVFPMPIESPNHGDRALVVDPADLTASPFGWHDTDGVDGAEFTITRGNNVHAYHDVFAQNASVGGEPDGGAMLEFDFPFDATNDTVYQQLDAATVNLFYWNNIIHDFIYQYGFDEVAGNFQSNNYDNGGNDGDYVRAEVTDGIGVNNANFFTPDDGQRPRMQMFIWNAENLPPRVNFLDAFYANGDTIEYEMRPAAFGAQLPEIPIVGPVVLIDDGVGNINDACENIGNDDELVGKIALIDRGSCSFGESVLRAESEGAIAVIVCNTDTMNQNSEFTMFPGDLGDQVTIPAVSVSYSSCTELKPEVDNVIISLGWPDSIILPSPGPTGIDSDFDNGVIVHEYGHGISNRLTGGPSSSNCLRNREQAGEGWSDWFALAMTTTSADTPNQGKGIGTYVSGDSPSAVGIRRYRYSRSLTVNPHTYGDIDDPMTSVPHGVGSIWAAMIWDLYWNMVDVYGFDDDLANGTGGNNLTIQLVMDGLKLQPCSPNFIDSRDAIIAADQANNNGANFCLIWETFARRGLGFSAQPEGEESFDTPLSCQFRLKLDKTAALVTDAGDVLTYSLEIKNDSPDPLTNVVITDTLPSGVTLVDGSVSCANASLSDALLTIPLGDMAVGDSLVCTYQVTVDAAPFSYLLLDDGLENGISNWNVSSVLGNELFQPSDNSYEGAKAWFAPNQPIESDMRLTTTNSYLINDPEASLSFWTQVKTESNKDGGRVEISTDGGANWEDLRSHFVQNGYTSLLQNDVIDGQHFGFAGDRGRYFQSIVDLSSFQGETIKIRFRFTSDDEDANEGWYIDNIKLFGNFHSITNAACASSDLDENICDEVTTVVFGEPEPVATQNIDSEIGVSIFPNPSDGKVFIKIEKNNNAATSLRLVGLDGRLLKQKDLEFSNGVIDFDVSEFPNGIYLLQVQTEDTQVVRKLILQE